MIQKTPFGFTGSISYLPGWARNAPPDVQAAVAFMQCNVNIIEKPMNCRVCNIPGRPGELVDHSEDGKGLCFKCLKAERDLYKDIVERNQGRAEAAVETLSQHQEGMPLLHRVWKDWMVRQLSGITEAARFALKKNHEPTLPTTAQTIPGPGDK